ncbi:MAG: hypothetical protein IPN45_08545 [Actinomycetales bacterium]|nr:hypothetical protein [Actinomycetales bacterium]
MRTRRMDRLVRTLMITGLSKSHMSVATKDLDEAVAAFRVSSKARVCRDTSNVHHEGPSNRNSCRRCHHSPAVRVSTLTTGESSSSHRIQCRSGNHVKTARRPASGYFAKRL